MPYPIGTLERNGPLVADKARALADSARAACKAPRYAVVSLHYGTYAAPAGHARVWLHKAPRAAWRRLGSVTGGKLRAQDSYAVALVTPCGRVLSWKEMQGILAN
jgi:hypothetical protein